jgi:hypothetical protein
MHLTTVKGSVLKVHQLYEYELDEPVASALWF